MPKGLQKPGCDSVQKCFPSEKLLVSPPLPIFLKETFPEVKKKKYSDPTVFHFLVPFPPLLLSVKERAIARYSKVKVKNRFSKSTCVSHKEYRNVFNKRQCEQGQEKDAGNLGL